MNENERGYCMNELKIFENPQFGKIRAIQKDGEPWFVAVDVCKALELDDVNKAMARIDEDEGARIEIPHPQSPGKMLEVNAVNEPGLYSLVLGSRKPEAKPLSGGLPTRSSRPSARLAAMPLTGRPRNSKPSSCWTTAPSSTSSGSPPWRTAWSWTTASNARWPLR